MKICVLLLTLVLTVSSAGAVPTAEPAPDPRVAEPIATPIIQPTGPGLDAVPQAHCLTFATCHDNTEIFCSSAQGNCTSGTESCSVADCNGTRKFVQCGSTKEVCPCDIGSCQPCQPPTGCTPGASCTSEAQCGPCGSCESGLCVCLVIP